MPVVALNSHGLHREPSPPRTGALRINMSPEVQKPGVEASKDGEDPRNIDSGIAFVPSTPHTGSPTTSVLPASVDLSSSVAGPSTMRPSTGSGPRPIPPPPTPRRHKSGVLMSKMRASTTKNSPYGDMGRMTSSKSHGDLTLAGELGPISRLDSDTEDEEVLRSAESANRERKRVGSEGVILKDDSEMWDNSARFYHHLHSRPASRAGSRGPSPIHSPSIKPSDPFGSPSNAASPLFVRRSVKLPPSTSISISDTSGTAGGSHQPAVSPNHNFLQQHLPPTFPFGHADMQDGFLSSEHAQFRPQSMVILTPTTQEWRELKELKRLEDGTSDDEKYEDDFSDMGDWSSRRASLANEGESAPPRTGLLLDPGSASGSGSAGSSISGRPAIRKSLSAEFIGEEKSHVRDPGASPEKAQQKLEGSGAREKSPIRSNAPKTPARQPLMERHNQPSVESHPSMDEVDVDQPLTMAMDDDSPVRFNSIGKRPSLAAIRNEARPGVTRAKTKREREREKLFKDLDDQLEADRMSDSDTRPKERPPLPGWNSGVQEIGLGGGLGSRPNSSTSLSESRSTSFKDLSMNDNPITRTVSSPTDRVSPTQPLKPSPLHTQSVTDLASTSSLNTNAMTRDISSTSSIIMDSSPSKPHNLMQSPSPGSRSHNLDSIRDYAKTLVSQHGGLPPFPKQRTPSGQSIASPPLSPTIRRRRDNANRVSLVAGRVVQPFAIPTSTALPPDHPTANSNPSLQSFSPFRSPKLGPSSASPNGLQPPSFHRLNSTISIAPSVGAPSECGTPTSETAGGIGGRGIDDYVILKEAGKGAYGLVMRAKVKGPKGEPVGDEVIIKYIVKARILADCWKKHKSLGPIPVEIHVMDQLRHLLYNRPIRPHPWDPSRPRTGQMKISTSATSLSDSDDSTPTTPDSPRSEGSFGSAGLFSPTQKYIASELRHSPQRGHPNIAKLLDFFEDKEFYYLVMPRFGTGLDLFDRVESQPDGLDPFEVRSLIGQLADAIRFLHSNGIVHRDIKDENVILDGSGRCQLIDFGSAAHWRPGKKWDTFSGTLHYASPEILRGEPYGGKEQDVWALGVVGYVLLVGETPFSDLPDEVLTGLTEESDAYKALQSRCGGPNADEGKEEDGGGRLGDAADLVTQCLAMEPNERPSADVICQHRYLRGEGGWIGKKGWVPMGWK